MPKRKTSQATHELSATPTESRRRSVRLQKSETGDPEVDSKPNKKTKFSPGDVGDKTESVIKKRVSKSEEKNEIETSSAEEEPPTKKGRSGRQQAQTKAAATKGQPASPVRNATSQKNPKIKASSSSAAAAASAANKDDDAQERNYWLLKAEPESRFENGIDVKFSIDDLAARTEPEPWDGIRNYAARNNLRAMKKGDLAFFYHSNCKEPGIVGIMEIVREHSPDLSAHDPKAAYYDPKSSPDDPKWSVVHVKFYKKFAVPIGLKELKEMGGAGKPLENMQMIRQSRLSVSKVSREEWEYLIGVAEERARNLEG